MKIIYAFLLMLATLTLGACDRSPPPAMVSQPPMPPTRPAEIPGPDELTLATPADIKAAAALSTDPTIQKAVNDYLGASADKWEISAARPIGDYLLLWIGFPYVDDGGIDLVYSTKLKRVEWKFKGGIRG